MSINLIKPKDIRGFYGMIDPDTLEELLEQQEVRIKGLEKFIKQQDAYNKGLLKAIEAIHASTEELALSIKPKG